MDVSGQRIGPNFKGPESQKKAVLPTNQQMKQPIN
jgi:hypothetical protein